MQKCIYRQVFILWTIAILTRVQYVDAPLIFEPMFTDLYVIIYCNPAILPIHLI